MFNRLYRHTFFPLIFQLVALAAFVALVATGLLTDPGSQKVTGELRKTNIANLLVWSYWWPLIVLFAIFVGRVWCMVCPMELVTSLAAMVGLRRKPPALLRSGWLVTIFYMAVLLVGVHTLRIHVVPFRMAVYLLILLGVVVICGLLFSRNAFCTYMCPVAYLLGLYARLAPFGWGVRDKSACSHCADKSCAAKEKAHKFIGRSCGVRLYPARIDDNSTCLLCGQCLKACQRNNPGQAGRPNPAWQRRPWFKDLLALRPLTAAQMLLCLLVSGEILFELMEESKVSRDLLLWLPRQVERLLGITGGWSLRFTQASVLFLVVPALFWLLPYVLFRLCGGRLKAGDYLLRFGVAFVPIMAAAHVGAALIVTTSLLPYWQHAFSDPLGIATARGIMQKTVRLWQMPWAVETVVEVLSLLLMGIALALSVFLIRKLTRQHLPQGGWRSLPLYALPLLYGGVAFAVVVALVAR